KLSFRQRLLQVVAQDFELFRTAGEISGAAKVVRHDKATTANVFAEICDLFVVKDHETGLGEIKEWILKHIWAVEADNLIRIRVDTNTGQFMNQRDNKFVSIRVVVMPGRVVREIGRPISPGIRFSI